MNIGKMRESELPETPPSSAFPSRNEPRPEHRYGLRIWKDFHLAFLSPFPPLGLTPKLPVVPLPETPHLSQDAHPDGESVSRVGTGLL